ncbi:hypothetical protein [Bordetella sp. FB-8]|uniref:hypothetical protein n=1 Tax=Bordetella sp. FB-8 TaxID=1159870 RepID=UPI0003681CB5|nr:hypothetical protein [Bordetella sp. FB-8]
MTMKKFDLAKNKALKLTNALKQTHSDRFGKSAASAETAPDRREQRLQDQAKGLVSFACKLDSKLVAQLRERAAGHPEGMNGLLDELLRAALAA